MAGELDRHNTASAVDEVEVDADEGEQLVLSDLINRVLDKGVVISGQVTISVADIDLIALDLNDPVGPAAALYSLEFFQQLRTALAPGGALTLHLGSPVAQPQRVADLAQRLNSVFRIVRVYTMYIPLYGSLWSMAVCSDKLDPKSFTADEIDRRIEQRKLQELRFYNGETHEGVFALPNYVRELVIPARLKQPARGRRLGVVRAAAK
jgi:predicted membrane-bound spermidine synthase